MLFSKTYPSFLTVKEGSTFLTKPLFPQGREDVTALRCSEPLRSKVGGPSKVFASFCGMGPPGDNNTICQSLMLIYICRLAHHNNLSHSHNRFYTLQRLFCYNLRFYSYCFFLSGIAGCSTGAL